jgi:branched-chain amino acid transport system ATP-binding protein
VSGAGASSNGTAAAAVGADGLGVRSLTVDYGAVRAVDGLDLDVPAGSCVALIGANGAGKTSALRAIGGLAGAGSRAQITVGGRDVGRLSAARRASAGLGHVLEGRHVFPDLSVVDNLRLGAFLASEPIPDRIGAVLDVLPELAPMLQRPAGTLSGGQQQMLAIGRMLAAAPRVAMLDEPTNGLAPVMVERVIEILRRLCGLGLAVLLVEQRLEVAQATAGHVLMLRRGRVVDSARAGDPSLAERAHAAYLGS